MVSLGVEEIVVLTHENVLNGYYFSIVHANTNELISKTT